LILTARKVDKSDIGNMTAQNNAISLRVSSVVSVEMLVTWLETVPTDREDRIGAMGRIAYPLVLSPGLEELTKSIALMR